MLLQSSTRGKDQINLKGEASHIYDKALQGEDPSLVFFLGTVVDKSFSFFLLFIKHSSSGFCLLDSSLKHAKEKSNRRSLPSNIVCSSWLAKVRICEKLHCSAEFRVINFKGN